MTPTSQTEQGKPSSPDKNTLFAIQVLPTTNSGDPRIGGIKRKLDITKWLSFDNSILRCTRNCGSYATRNKDWIATAT